MKLLGTMHVVCLLLLVMGCGTTKQAPLRSGYTVSTNNLTVISWQGQEIYRGKTATLSVSPDGRSVAWVEERLVAHRDIDNKQEPVCAGALHIAHDGGAPVIIQEVRNSRGFELPDPSLIDGLVWNPTELKWDSTSEFLYFTTLPWTTRSMLWQLKRGETAPSAIALVWEYRLLKKLRGPDWVEVLETNYERQSFDLQGGIRDWTTTYIYMPEEMAAKEYIRPARRGSIGKDWPKQ